MSTHSGASSASTMQITVNGQPLAVAHGTTISDILREQGVRSELVAVEVNLEIVPKLSHDRTVLNEGDQVEVVTLVGGG